MIGKTIGWTTTIAMVIGFMDLGCSVDTKNSDTCRHTVQIDSTALVSFALEMSMIQINEAITKSDSLLQQAEADSIVFIHTVPYLRNIWDNPNSPLRNENLWINTLEYIIHSPHYQADERKTFSKELKLLRQNSVGELANDFEYTNMHGTNTKLFSIRMKYVLLLFYNPECSACVQLKMDLQDSELINRKLHAGELAIVAIYPDLDLNLWLRHLKEFPRNWVIGRSSLLHETGTYNLRAIPSMYLLDENKFVILKDAESAREIEWVLEF